MSKIKAIIFDLDKTLYDMGGQRIEPALRSAVDAMIKAGLSCSPDEGFKVISNLFYKHLKSNNFLGLAKMFAEPGTDITEIAKRGRDAYYTYKSTKLTLFSGVQEMLEELRSEHQLALITFGDPIVQNKKLDLLGIRDFFDIVTIATRPDKEECFLDVIDELGVKQNRILVVGDRPDSEIRIGNKLGMTSVRVLHGRYKTITPETELEKADYEIPKVVDLPDVMDDIHIKEGKLIHGPKIALIGAGTGVPTLIEGLKKYTYNLSAIVNVIDEGRSSGILRRELGVPPPGDIRNNIVALSDSEQMLAELFQYRFDEGSLKGHSFGNLLLAAMTKITGNFQRAIREMSKILNLRGSVYPASLVDVKIGATLVDGSILRGEQEIVVKGDDIHTTLRPRIKEVFLEPKDAPGNPAAIQAIVDADLIVIGPGSLMSSIVPNILLTDITEAIKKSKAKKLYVCNIMTQPGQTEGFTASDHVKFLLKYLGPGVLDYAIINNELPSKPLVEQYEKDNSFVVSPDPDELRKLGVTPIEANLIEPMDENEKRILWEKLYLLRHDSNKIAEIIMSLIKNGDGEKNWNDDENIFQAI